VRLSFGYLQFIEDAPTSDGDQWELKRGSFRDKSKSLQESPWTPLEASHDQFFVTPPSHFAHQKAKGFRLMGFFLSVWEKRRLMNALMRMESQVDNCLCFHH
jgi:hypothetical protein